MALQLQLHRVGHIFLLLPKEVHRQSQRSGSLVQDLLRFTTAFTNGYMTSEALLQRLLRRWSDEHLSHQTCRSPLWWRVSSTARGAMFRASSAFEGHVTGSCGNTSHCLGPDMKLH